MSILAQLVEYTKNPTTETGLVTKNKFWVLLQFAGLFITLSFLVGLPQEYLLKIVGFDSKNHLINLSIKNDPYWQVFLSSVLFAPVFEEISYRLWLRPTFKNLVFGLGFLLSTILGSFFSLDWLLYSLPIVSYEVFTVLYFFLISGISIFVVGALLLLFEKIVKSSFADHTTGSKKFKFVYYSSIVLFALVHTFNYDITKVWIIAPILVLPQLLIGLYFGFVRMNFGLKWSIVAHCLHNFLLISPILLISEGVRSIQDRLQSNEELTPNLISLG